MKWAEVALEARRKGRPIQTADAWIAAGALHYKVPLIMGATTPMIDKLQVLT